MAESSAAEEKEVVEGPSDNAEKSERPRSKLKSVIDRNSPSYQLKLGRRYLKKTRNFFRWLLDTKVIEKHPSNGVIHKLAAKQIQYSKYRNLNPEELKKAVGALIK